MNKPKILVILGPTASGKSDLAVSLAKKFNGEIISADSRQVYKGLDIGSGKITKKEMGGITHHLLDIENPKKVFSVAMFQRLGKKAIDDILSRGKLPIVAGGTGFYIDSLVFETNIPEVPENKNLRKELEKENIETLFTMLETLDPERAEEIDSKNKVRLIRAIEIVKAIGKVPKSKQKNIYNTLWLGILWPDEILRKRIHNRILSRMQTGMLKEVKDLHTKGLSWKRMESLGLEYRYLSLFLQNKISKEKMLEELENKIWQFAKRQKTWFRRNKKIKWLSPERLGESEVVVKKWLS